ncbi:MAG: nuclear transport factor 2 family protein [Ramlibacter sp.]
MRLIFSAVERRDRAQLDALYHPQVTFVWPAPLPYGGTHTGDAIKEMTARFTQTWDPLQPEPADRRLDPELVAASQGEVVFRYLLKGRDSSGHTHSADTLARYTMQDGRLFRAQMYCFELLDLLTFLATAKPVAPGP